MGGCSSKQRVLKSVGIRPIESLAPPEKEVHYDHNSVPTRVTVEPRIANINKRFGI